MSSGQLIEKFNTLSRNYVKPNVLASSRYMRITGLPRTATPADVRRLCVKNKVENTESFALAYDRFKPTGTAIITFTKPDYSWNALKALHRNTLGGSHIEAELIRPNDLPRSRPRTRGIRGKSEAVERGVFDGNGLNAGLTRNGANVLISGLPGKYTPELMKMFVRSFKLAGYEKGDIIKVEPQNVKLVVLSSFILRLATVSEAHRLVRTIHQTYYRPDLFMEKYLLKAHVIY